MKEQFWQYVNNLYNNVPVNIYEGLLLVFFIGTIFAVLLTGIKKGLRLSSALLLIEYLVLIFCSTVYFRVSREICRHNYTPFWSYAAIQDGRKELLYQNIMNVLTFVLVGMLLGCAFRSMNWWKVLVVGLGISIAIETMQLLFHRGFTEVDDVLHNTFGCMIGYGIYKLGALVVRQKNNI